MTSAPFVRAEGVDLLRRPLAILRRPPPPAPRAVAARRAVDRLLVAATLASLGAAVGERRARNAVPPTPIPSFPVDLGTDQPARLRLLPGLGAARVAALLRERDRRGAPEAWSDLDRVRGIGAKTLATWRTSGATLRRAEEPLGRAEEPLGRAEEPRGPAEAPARSGDPPMPRRPAPSAPEKGGEPDDTHPR